MSVVVPLPRTNMNFFKFLPNEASVLYIHSSYESVHMYTKSSEHDQINHYLMNKELGVVSMHRIETDLNIKQLEFKGWYRPTIPPEGGSLLFTGCLQLNEEYYKFSVVDHTLTLGEKIDISPRFKFESLKTLANIDIERHVQRGNVLYITGVDRCYNEQVFLEVCMRTDKAVRRYNLRSDLGDLKVNTINLDSEKGRIYIGGEVCKYDELDNCVSVAPYFECFNFFN